MNEVQIYLASRSPRRRELLDQIGVHFELVGGEIDETHQGNESPLEYVKRMALGKALCGQNNLLQDEAVPVLGADTSVVIGGTIFGKPSTYDEAADMLSQLAGRTHSVMSAVALVRGDEHKVSISTSKVSFADLSDVQIRAYWDSGEPLDKAGGYAIQGKGAIFVTELSGSYSGVMGLPLYETVELLKEFGVWNG